MELLITPTGTVRCIYAEDLPLAELGRLNISRASHVEPTYNGQWTADLSPVHGPLLGPFPDRSTALAAEHTYLSTNWLSKGLALDADSS